MIDRLGMTIPLVQAPTAGVSTPALAAAVSNAGGLGSIGVGTTDAEGARVMIDEVRSKTGCAFNVNLFVHAAPVPDPAREAARLDWLAPLFAEFDAEPPAALRTIYRSFADDPDMQALILDAALPVVSFHFGLPDSAILAALRERGCMTMATATNLDEARAIEAAGIDMVVAQGIERAGISACSTPPRPIRRWARWR